MKDLAIIEKTVDWAFSSPYKGTIETLKKCQQNIDDVVDLPHDIKASFQSNEEEFKASLETDGAPEIPVHS